MTERRRVTFRFPTHSEVRYPLVAPKRGERLTRGRDRDWLVIRLELDAAGLEIALCSRFADYMRQARRDAASMRGVAAEARERAHEAVDEALRQRARVSELERTLLKRSARS